MTNYARNAIYTGDDVRAVADHASSHFFNSDTMRFFDSRLLSGVIALDGYETVPGHRYLFVTSERDTYSDQPRRYTVRMLTLGSVRDDRPAVEIDTVDDFQAFATARAAKAFAQSLKDLPECGLVTYRAACRLPAHREIWHGSDTPARACAFHADMFTSEVINAHKDKEALASRFGPDIAKMPLDPRTVDVLLDRF